MKNFNMQKSQLKEAGEEKQFRRYLLVNIMWGDMMNFTRWIRKESSIHCLKASVSFYTLTLSKTKPQI